jgi:hypothetical protein
MQRELDEVVRHYNSGNRAITDGSFCCYHPTPTSEGCALGRKFTEEEQKVAEKFQGSVDMLTTVLIPEYWADFSFEFVCDLQGLHDNRRFWTETGLSESGWARVGKMQRFIRSGEYDRGLLRDYRNTGRSRRAFASRRKFHEE